MKKKERYVILYEDMLSKFDIIAEGYQALREMFERNTTRLEQEIKGTNVMLHLMVDTLNQKIEDDKKDLIETRQELKTEIQDVKQELKTEIQDVKQELKTEIQGVKQELKAEIQDVRQELKAEIQGVKEELIDRIDGVRQDLGKKIDRVVDRLENHEMRIVLLEEAA